MKNIKKKVGILTILFAVTVGIYLQTGWNVKVIGNYTVNDKNGYEENIVIVANKLWIIDQKELAEELIKRCVDNSFYEILFSYDKKGYPNGVHFTVYANDITYKLGIEAFKADYEQRGGERYQYNIMEHPDKFGFSFQ